MWCTWSEGEDGVSGETTVDDEGQVLSARVLVEGVGRLTEPGKLNCRYQKEQQQTRARTITSSMCVVWASKPNLNSGRKRHK